MEDNNIKSDQKLNLLSATFASAMIPISITSKAIEEIRQIMETKQIPAGYGLRVGIGGTGCAGISFQLGFDQANESDKVFEFGGLEVLIAKSHMMYLVGKEVDFFEGADASGFVFNDSEG